MADVGVVYCTQLKHHTVTVDFCDGHRVTGSLAAWSWLQAVFGQSQAMTPVVALSTARIGVATCWQKAANLSVQAVMSARIRIIEPIRRDRADVI